MPLLFRAVGASLYRMALKNHRPIFLIPFDRRATFRAKGSRKAGDRCIMARSMFSGAGWFGGRLGGWLGIVVGILGIVLLTVGAPRADDAEDEDIVISANRVATPISEIGSSVSVITAEDLEERGTMLVSDVLREVPGISVSRSGGIGGFTEVRMRGAESNQVVVLVDGVKVNDPSTGLFAFENLTAANVERIEVVRGSRSMQHGADAIGGVISIITKKAKAGEEALHAGAKVEYGSHATWNQSAYVSGRNNGLDYALDISRLVTNGVSSFAEKGNVDPLGDPIYNSENDPYQNLSVNSRVGYQATDTLRFDSALWLLNSKSNFDDDGFDPDTFQIFYADTPSQMTFDALSGRLAAKLSSFEGKLEQTLALSYYQTRREATKVEFPSKQRAKRQKLEYQADLRIDERQRISLGAEAEQNHFRSVAWGYEETTRNEAAFAEYAMKPVGELNVVVGLREDWHDEYGANTTYSASASYPIEKTGTRLRASWSTGFAEPNVFELHGFFGNPDIKPEQSKSWEVGVEQGYWDDRIEVELTYFENRIRDLIVPTSEFVYDNIEKSFTRGTEFQVSLDPSEGLEIVGSYTYMVPKDEQTHDDLLRRPRNVGSLNLNYRFLETTSLNLGLIVNGHQHDSNGAQIDSYALVNLKLAYDLGDHFQLFGRVENLLNKDYVEVVHYQTLGRVGFIGVSCTY